MLRKRSSPSFLFFFILSYPLVFPLGSIFQSHDVSIPQLKVNDISQSKEDKKKKIIVWLQVRTCQRRRSWQFCILYFVFFVLSVFYSLFYWFFQHQWCMCWPVIWKQRISILSLALFCSNIGTVSSFLIPLHVEQSVAMWNKIRRVWSVL